MRHSWSLLHWSGLLFLKRVPRDTCWYSKFKDVPVQHIITWVFSGVIAENKFHVVKWTWVKPGVYNYLSFGNIVHHTDSSKWGQVIVPSMIINLQTKSNHRWNENTFNMSCLWRDHLNIFFKQFTIIWCITFCLASCICSDSKLMCRESLWGKDAYLALATKHNTRMSEYIFCKKAE